MLEQLRIHRVSNALPVGQRPDWFPLVRNLLGAILVIAAGLKSGSDPLMADAILGVSYMVLVLGELAFAAWLFSGRQPAFSWWACIACFANFAIFAGYKVLIGDPDCGCFGAISSPPWVALAIDLTVLSVLCVVGQPRTRPVSVPCGAGFQPAAMSANTTDPRCGRQAESLPHIRARVTARFGFVRATAYAIVLLLAARVGLMSLSHREIGHNIVMANPSDWPGSQFPLLRSTDLSEHLSSGQWLVVLHRPGCAVCEELLAKLAVVSDRNFKRETPRLAILELPGGSTDVHRELPILAIHGRVTDRAVPLLAAPLLTRLDDGEVVFVTEGDQSLQKVDEMLGSGEKFAEVMNGTFSRSRGRETSG